ELVGRAADSAHALHESGVVHRDIKPGNILVTRDGTQAVLMDLGLAKFEEPSDSQFTTTGQILGTDRYLSPEQAVGAADLGRAADIYSLGATLWEMLALTPLFGIDHVLTRDKLLSTILYDEPDRLRRLNRAVSRDLEAVAHKCLEKNPKSRYA